MTSKLWLGVSLFFLFQFRDGFCFSFRDLTWTRVQIQYQYDDDNDDDDDIPLISVKASTLQMSPDSCLVGESKTSVNLLLEQLDVDALVEQGANPEVHLRETLSEFGEIDRLQFFIIVGTAAIRYTNEENAISVSCIASDFIFISML